MSSAGCAATPLLILALLGTAFWLYGPHWPLLLLALLGRAFVVSFLDNAPHYDGALAEPDQGYDLRLPRPLARLVLNTNLHGTHHRHPNLPWTALPGAFARDGVGFAGSYLLTPWRQLRGPMPLTPRLPHDLRGPAHAADAPADHLRETARTYDRIAPLYDLLDGIYEHSWKRRLRETLFAHAHGRILDVGVGTRCNIPFYPEGSKVVGIDMSERMLNRARDRARELGRPMTLRPMNLLSLDFPMPASTRSAAPSSCSACRTNCRSRR